ncbi:CYTH domain-containing protein [Meiothermus hypogaeus]|uniref:CYTH domain-containing protein n=2 Tax=Meiothermus hypogaeus TaxID=884155 RepID=A0A511R1N4_9DEIN|nr:CYTH domain-containing protein [Meiothermus hypogaeus]RIH76448.1 Inorganic triphosphatase [Meiothermus hypogaeus]GEM83514.1 CYTH domain-containing protein [Meiothermus hypogaeus NBRC 106114]
MGSETERKFLVRSSDWKPGAVGVLYRQGYLCRQEARTVRVRIAGDQAYLTIKGQAQGLTRLEYEYPLPLAEAQELLEQLCLRPLIEKTRYRIEYRGRVWEVDEFVGENQGLVVAEVELKSPDQPLELPDWVGEEVTHDPRYLNANLVVHPFSRWGKP